jgi:hypothetical protein
LASQFPIGLAVLQDSIVEALLLSAASLFIRDGRGSSAADIRYLLADTCHSQRMRMAPFLQNAGGYPKGYPRPAGRFSFQPARYLYLVDRKEILPVDEVHVVVSQSWISEHNKTTYHTGITDSRPLRNSPGPQTNPTAQVSTQLPPPPHG